MGNSNQKTISSSSRTNNEICKQYIASIKQEKQKYMESRVKPEENPPVSCGTTCCNAAPARKPSYLVMNFFTLSLIFTIIWRKKSGKFT